MYSSSQPYGHFSCCTWPINWWNMYECRTIFVHMQGCEVGEITEISGKELDIRSEYLYAKQKLKHNSI